MNGKTWAAERLFGGPGPGEEPSAAGEGLAAWLERVRPGEAQRLGRLEIVPLRFDGETASVPRLLLARDAIARGLLEVRERGDGGMVQELEAHNRGELGVLVLEGETLLGCKQNRVVAHSVIVPAGTAVVVPVGCMERGRWSRVGPKFASGGLRMDPMLRRQTVAETVRARARGARVGLDQRRLWRQVEERLAASAIASPTADYEDVLENEEAAVREEAGGVRALPGQVGIIALLDGGLLGLELVGHPEDWAALARDTLPSYLLGARAERASAVGAGRPRGAEEVLSALRRAAIREHPGLGLGTDLEVAAPGLVGSGLWHESAPAHLAVFAAD